MGGILIRTKTSRGQPREWSGQPEDVVNFFNRKGIGAILVAASNLDSQYGVITFDTEARTMTIDSDKITPSKETVRFWNCLGFEVLSKLKGDV